MRKANIIFLMSILLFLSGCAIIDSIPYRIVRKDELPDNKDSANSAESKSIDIENEDFIYVEPNISEPDKTIRSTLKGSGADPINESIKSETVIPSNKIRAVKEESQEDIYDTADDDLYDLSSYPRKTGDPYVIKGITYYPMSEVDSDYSEIGIASWYGTDFHNKKTANGETYNMYAMTAAHKTLPIPTYVKVENLENGKEVVVRINDRGPYSKGRVIDLSYEAAKRLDIIDQGTAKVKITVLSQSKEHLRTNNKDIDINIAPYAIQIASFANKENAERLAQSYNNTEIIEADVSGKIFYRVRLTGFNTREEAEQALAHYGDTHPSAFVLAE